MRTTPLRLAVGLLAATPAVANTVQNGSFEYHNATWCTYALDNATASYLFRYNLAVWGSLEDLDLQRSGCDVEPHDGLWALGMNASGGRGSAVTLYLTWPLIVGETYTIELWTYGNTSVSPWIPSLRVGTSTTTRPGDLHGVVTPLPGMWTPHSVTFVAASPDQHVTLEVDASAGGVGALSVDAVTIYDGAPPDQDGDGVPDLTDNCVDVANADQADLEGDGAGDACDPAAIWEGQCPGPTQFVAAGLTPGGRVALLRAAGPGAARIPSGPCAGTDTGMTSPALVGMFTADAAGGFTVNPTLSRAQCGVWVRAVDMTTCALTDLLLAP